LITAFMVLSFPGSSSGDGAAEPGVSPLYDYRYAQAAEDLGLIDSEASIGKLSYGSIPTASLSPEDKCQGNECRLTIKEANDDGEETSLITCGGATSCGGVQTCGSTCGSTCSSSCGSTCANTCSSSCGLASCGPVTACGGVYTCGNTCADTCGDTCANTCGLITCGGATSCGGIQTCADTCSSTCADTCASTCGLITCGGATSCGGIQTCANTCGSTCAQTCAASCGRATSCGGAYTCSNTCSETCGYTCYSTCYSTCFNTCGYTCANTCARSCSSTCDSRCIPANVVPMRNAPMANSTIKTPTAAQQNSAVPYDVNARPPASVYYNGSKMPWAAFNQSFASNYPLAWAEIYDRSWGTGASTPLGTWVREFVYVQASGNLVLSMTTAGITTKRDFGPTTPGYRYVWFYADRPGAHVSIFSVRGVQSNPVTIFAY